MPNQSEEERQPAVVEVRWSGSAEVEPVYANQLTVSHASGAEFVLTFGRLLLPTAPESLDDVRIETVARIIVSPKAFAGFVKAARTNLDRYDEKQDKEG